MREGKYCRREGTLQERRQVLQERRYFLKVLQERSYCRSGVSASGDLQRTLPGIGRCLRPVRPERCSGFL